MDVFKFRLPAFEVKESERPSNLEASIHVCVYIHTHV